MTCWNRVPPIGDTEQYLKAIDAFPLLTREEEVRIGENLNEESILRLTLSHLRLAASLARRYYNFGIPFSDLIQEANMGLFDAAKRFNHEKGRFSTYATSYIRAYLHNYLRKNTRTVVIATTKPQTKVYFNLSAMKQEILKNTGSSSLSRAQYKEIAEKLSVPVSDVIEMDFRMSGHEYTLETDTEIDDAPFSWGKVIVDTRYEPTEVIDQAHNEFMLSDGLQDALEYLDERQRFIIETRWLADQPLGLADLAAIFDISSERVRQLELKALKVLREAMEEYV